MFFDLLASISVFSVTSVLNPFVRLAPAPLARCSLVQVHPAKPSHSFLTV